MVNFNDLISSDLENVFFEEFATVHTVNSKTLKIVVDNDRLMERSKKEYDGITVGEVLFFSKAIEFGERLDAGAPLTFDGRLMYVFDFREDNGLYEIILNQNRGA